MQNQDLVQRSDAMSGLRSSEQGKFFGDLAKSAAEMHRMEELKDNTVQKDDESEGLNPDGGNSGQEQKNKKRQHGEEEEQPKTNTPAGHPIKLDGGDVLDIMA
ncbi:MAG: hypothetical protein LBH25_08560 [Fibromonadaceae bacterium]|nr:hypothetical protein [Fibromonadaceae bacterium]